MKELTEAETTDSMGIMPRCTTKKQLSPRLESTAKDIPDKEIPTAEKGTGTDGTFTDMNGTVMFHSGLRLPLSEEVSSETREKANDTLGSDDDTIPDEDQIPDNGPGDLDNHSAMNEAMSHFQAKSYMVTSSCDLESRSEISLGSKGIDTTPVVFPLNDDGLISPTAGDALQLPLSPENYQLGFKRKNSPPLEVRTDKVYRNIRARIDKTRGDFQFDDTCEKDHTSQLLPPPRNVYNLEAIHSNREFSRSGVSPHNPRRDGRDGHFSCHPVLSDLSSVVKDEIERVCNGILRPDFAGFMAKHIPTLLLNGLCHSHIDAIQPPVDPGPSSDNIWSYVRALSAEGEIRYLKSRLVQIMLYLNYIAELDRQRSAGHPSETAKTNAIEIVSGANCLPKAAAVKARKYFLRYKLIGERWWWCGCFLGHGFFLLCSEKMGKKVSKFDHMTDSLLAGRKMSVDLSENEIRQWIYEAKDAGPSTILWERWNTNTLASKASEFLLVHPPVASL
ncbi:unnamed protein product [Penicillium pancosmium]